MKKKISKKDIIIIILLVVIVGLLIDRGISKSNDYTSWLYGFQQNCLGMSRSNYRGVQDAQITMTRLNEAISQLAYMGFYDEKDYLGAMEEGYQAYLLQIVNDEVDKDESLKLISQDFKAIYESIGEHKRVWTRRQLEDILRQALMSHERAPFVQDYYIHNMNLDDLLND